MQNKDEALVIERTGAVRVEGSALKAQLAEASGRYRVVECDGTVLMLLRDGGQESASRVLMAGELVARTTVMEVASVLAQNNWRGVLHIAGKSSLRKLSIAEGALKAASSTVPTERLGEIMVSLGMISPEQLAHCVRSLSPSKRIGEIAIGHGYLTREQLFSALQRQMQRIFENALLEESGLYALTRRDEADASVPAVLLHIPLQRLLMESVQRIDEMALFRERIPSGDLCPMVTARGSRSSLTPSLRPVIELADGEHSIHEMAQALRADEYTTTKWVCQLLQIGAVEILPQRKLDVEEAERMIVRFNQVLKRIFDTVERYGKRDDIAWTVDAWVRGTTFCRYFEDTMRQDGTIDPALAIDKLDALDEDAPLETLNQALHDLAAFVMLSASSVLPLEAERSLSRIVGQKLTHLQWQND